MTLALRGLVLALSVGIVALAALPARAADWQAKEVVKPYDISGTTGPELYASIGEKGPVVGEGRRTIAYTTFELKWSRNYVPEGGSCRLVSAKPFLTIIYVLPKAPKKLPEDTRRLWDTFIEGIRAHEKVHGDIVRDMVTAIIDTTVGLTVADDPNCKKIRKEIEKPLLAALQAQKQRNREFDKIEMSDGGNVHRLILSLLNGK